MKPENRAVSKAEQLHREAIQALSSGKLEAGISLLKRALDSAETDTAQSIILNDLGTACWQAGQNAIAEKHYAKAAKLAPHNARALGNYGAFLVEQRRLAEAEPLLKQALALMPDHYKIQNDMGRYYYKRGSFVAAEKYYRESIRLNPDWINARNNLGEVLADMGRHEEAEKEYQGALKISPKSASALGGLGRVRLKQRRDAEALEFIDRALELDPTLEAVWERKLNLLERTQRLDEANAALRQAREACPDSPRIVVFEAKLLRRAGKTDEALRLLEKMRGTLKADRRIDHPFMWSFFFELGELYDRANEADKAFDCFAKANAGEAEGAKAQALDKEDLLRRVTLLRENFTPALAEKPGAAPMQDRPAPVFLVGFPRSGTTLLDQILSSHPDIRVAEERPAVDLMARRITELYAAAYPCPPDTAVRGPIQLAGLVDFKASDIEEFRRVFYAEHGDLAKDWNGVFVDKLPLNIIHAGLIRRVFPDAKFILALRHPCDAVLSCFMQRFDLNVAMVQFLDLHDAARFYDEVFKLWDHYTQAMPLPVHAIRYEDVVGNFRPAVEGLLSYLGVPWNEAVMEFDKTARDKGRINTPSYHQVTQKIYTRASGRWLRYYKHLKPVLPVLGPHAMKLGYSVEPP